MAWSARTLLLQGSLSLRVSFIQRWFSATSHSNARKNYQDGEAFFQEKLENMELRGDENIEDMSDVFEKMQRQQKNQEVAIKYARAARDFPQPVEKRKFKWDTMQQIRFLYQDNPGEWTIPELAQSFGTTTPIIKKILKTKFVPSEERKKFQDAMVDLNLGLIEKGDHNRGSAMENKMLVQDGRKENLSLEGHTNFKALPEVEGGMKLRTRSNRRDKIENESMFQKDSRQFTSRETYDRIPEAKRNEKERRKGSYETERNNFVVAPKSVRNKGENESESLTEIRSDKRWRNQKSDLKMQSSRTESEVMDELLEEDEDVVVSREDFKQFFESDDYKEVPKITQRGREFFDENGEFLYRV